PDTARSRSTLDRIAEGTRHLHRAFEATGLDWSKTLNVQLTFAPPSPRTVLTRQRALAAAGGIVLDACPDPLLVLWGRFIAEAGQSFPLDVEGGRKGQRGIPHQSQHLIHCVGGCRRHQRRT